jgi:hypothetical protein
VTRGGLAVAVGVAALLTGAGERRAPAAPAALAAGTEQPASPSDADRTTALALVRDGNRLLDKGDPAAALQKFEEAHRLVGGDKLRFNLGQALGALPGREAEAYREFDLFVERVPTAAPEVARSARNERERLRARLGFLRVETTSAGAEIRIDGAPAGIAPLARSVPVAPGDHDVEVSAPGFAPFRGSVTLVAGQELFQAMTLVTAPAPAPVAGAPIVVAPVVGPAASAPVPAAALTAAPSPAGTLVAAPEQARAPIYKKWWFWTGIAGAVGVAVVSAVVLSRGADVMHTCPPEISRCQPLP